MSIPSARGESKAEKIKRLLENDISNRTIARVVECSESYVRVMRNDPERRCNKAYAAAKRERAA